MQTLLVSSNDLGAVLRDLRRQQGLTQAELGKKGRARPEKGIASGEWQFELPNRQFVPVVVGSGCRCGCSAEG